MTSSGRQPKGNPEEGASCGTPGPSLVTVNRRDCARQMKRNEGKTCRCNAVFWVRHWMRQTTLKDLFVLSGKI